MGFTAPGFSEFLGHSGHWPDPLIAGGSTVVALAGLALGYWAYGRRTVVLNTRSLKERAGLAYSALAKKLYFDLTYDYFIIKPYMRATEKLYRFDSAVVDGVVNGAASGWRALAAGAAAFDIAVIDGVVNGLATSARGLGGVLRRIQVGRVQTYQRYILGAVVLLMVWIVVKGA